MYMESGIAADRIIRSDRFWSVNLCALLPHTILRRLAVLDFVTQSMEKSVTEQDREIRDIVKRAEKNLDRTGAFVCWPLCANVKLNWFLISYSDERP